MTNTSDNPDKLDLILKKLEKLDAIELTLRDMASRIDRFTVVFSVTWPSDDSEARVDLVLIRTSLLLSCKFT